MSRSKTKEISVLFAAFLLSAVMLTLIQVPFHGSFLAWVSLVPFILVCGPHCKIKTAMLVSYLVSSCYWLVNLYWLSQVTMPAYILFCLYLGLYWPILVLCVRYCRRIRAKFPLFLSIPLIFVGAEAWQGIIITGFSWRLLGHSQYANLPLIQISDIFGALGVSFIIAMVNGLFAGLLIDSKKLLSKSNIFKTVIVSMVVFGTIVYGLWRLGESDEFIETGPLLGSVQSNVPSHIKEMSEATEEILDGLIEYSEPCMEAGAALVAWPETMVLVPLNSSYIEILRELNLQRDSLLFSNKLADHAKGKGYLLVGANSIEYEQEGTQYVARDRFNSAFFYRPDGKQDPKRYDKIHLVPFGEYIPFKESIPFIYNLVLKLTPYDYDYNLTKGEEFTIFDVFNDGKAYGFGVLICYEDTVPRIARKMVYSGSGQKTADWLVNISNDGWYVRYKDGKVLPSVELCQRTAISVFRAVENRISILRSVNTGISCLIESTGKIRDKYVAGNLPEKAMSRQGVGGWFVDRVRIDKRITFFSKYGQLLDMFCAVIVVIIMSASLITIFRDRKSGGIA